ncbi:MAG: hypothetical protein JJU06_02090 [Ectothiorhodospiraceae bacterium]|nr:hypothetical protein [Ectothiorhodospiraceae bacterium]
MDLWSTRKASLELLNSELKEQKGCIERAFGLIDSGIDFFNNHAATDQYSRISGLTLAKARNYALGAYGMILDNLAQEAGALNRPFLEYYELLIYFSEEPNRVTEAIEGQLPTAGKRAQLINSDLKGFREYLNQNASHSSYSEYSLRHLIDAESMSVKKSQSYAPDVLFRNLGDLFVQLILLGFQVAISMSVKDSRAGATLSEQAGRLRDHGGQLFELKARLEPEHGENSP